MTPEEKPHIDKQWQIWSDQGSLKWACEEPSGQGDGLTRMLAGSSWVMLGTKLPLQEMARGWTPGLLPLRLGWGTSPKERRGGGEGGG